MNSEVQQMPDISRRVFQEEFGRLSKIKHTAFLLILHAPATENRILKKHITNFKLVFLTFRIFFLNQRCFFVCLFFFSM